MLAPQGGRQRYGIACESKRSNDRYDLTAGAHGNRPVRRFVAHAETIGEHPQQPTCIDVVAFLDESGVRGSTVMPAAAAFANQRPKFSAPIRDKNHRAAIAGQPLIR
jgi:hypothetical protein